MYIPLIKYICFIIVMITHFPGALVVKTPPPSAGDVGLIPGLGSSSGKGYGNLLQHSFLENPMDKGA